MLRLFSRALTASPAFLAVIAGPAFVFDESVPMNFR